MKNVTLLKMKLMIDKVHDYDSVVDASNAIGRPTRAFSTLPDGGYIWGADGELYQFYSRDSYYRKEK